MNRRRYLAGLGAAGATALTGCGGLLETQPVGQPSVLEDRPDAVYVPTHVEGMEMIGAASAGRLQLALAYSYPHRFWTMDGNRTNRVDFQEDDSVHLMLTAWDEETGTAIPSSTARLTIRADGDVVDDRTAWPMLSQNMGFHYGDNVPLAGDGTYEVEVAFGPVDARRTGAFRDAFGEQVTHTFAFEYSQEVRDEIRFAVLDERQGERDALRPMDVERMPIDQLPAGGDLPGTPLSRGSVGDATVVATLLESAPEGVETTATGHYLAVSPRTPYNRYPIPFVSISAEVDSGGGERYAGPLATTIDPQLGYHHGRVIEGMTTDDDVTVTIENAAGVARHEGYETAFLESGSTELEGRS